MLMKTHLITIDQWDEYEVKWHKSLASINPVLNKDGLPTFILKTLDGRFEFTTLDIKYIVRQAKRLTKVKGREAVTIGRTFICVKTGNTSDIQLGTVYRKHTRKYAPMFDDVPI